jgi:phosphatidylinositol alpha-mannosyltransferase
MKRNNFKKPTIIFSSYDDIKNPYYGGGGARAIHEVARRLTDHFEVTVLTSRYAQAKHETIDQVKYKRIGTHLLGTRAAQLIFHLVLPYYCFTQKYDIWLESFTPPYSTSFLPLFTKKPVVGLAHMLSGREMTRKYKLPFYIIERLGLALYRNFIVLEETTKKDILKINKQARIGIIENGVSLPKYNFGQHQKYITYVGRIECNQKGIDLLLKAYSLFHERLIYPLAIAGSGKPQEMKKLRRLIEKLNLEKKIILLGRLDYPEVFKLFNQSVLVVIPSRIESFSLAALEALASGRAVVSFDIHGLKWLPRQASVKAQAFDYRQLSDIIENLAKNQQQREQMGVKAHEFSRKYAWQNIAHKYYTYLNSLL